MPQQGGFSPLHRETPQHHSLAKLWAKDLGGPKVPGDMYAHPLPSSPLTTCALAGICQTVSGEGLEQTLVPLGCLLCRGSAAGGQREVEKISPLR
jgi:hypothetical protein